MTNNLDSFVTALTEICGQSRRRFVVTVCDGTACISPEAIDSESDGSVLNNLIPHGGSLWIGVPWLSLECSRRWVGNRLFFFPAAVPDAKRIAVVSSRMSQRLDLESWWFDLLRTAVMQCKSQEEMLVVVNSTATCAAVARAAALFGRQIIRFDVSLPLEMKENEDARRWLAECIDKLDVCNSDGALKQELPVFVSPEINLTDVQSPSSELCHIPLCDRLLFAAANRIQVLACRTHGNVEKLAKVHLHDAERQATPLWIASNADGRLPAVVADLPVRCIPWLVAPCRRDAAMGVLRPPSAADGKQSSDSNAVPRTALSSPLTNPEEWLLHWTRAPRGPWPGESETDFLDALILGSESADRSALATLLKIIADGKLIASSEGIRGGFTVVSFTEVPLAEFRSRRVFRKHRNRFDFEPWGIALQKEQLRQLGVRPVIYGEEEDWKCLGHDDRAFFQKATRTGATNNINELEQRFSGSVDLRQFPKDSVCIFVGDPDSANLVAHHCDWRVVVVPDSHR